MTAKGIATAYLGAIVALTEAIRELGSVPSGHLYARVMSHISLEQYEKLIGSIVTTGRVVRDGHLLVWKGAGE